MKYVAVAEPFAPPFAIINEKYREKKNEKYCFAPGVSSTGDAMPVKESLHFTIAKYLDE